MKVAVFWVVTPYSLVEVYRRFRGAFCLPHQSPEDSHVLKITSFKTEFVKSGNGNKNKNLKKIVQLNRPVYSGLTPRDNREHVEIKGKLVPAPNH
jgi:hypothetical protein